MWTEKIWRPFQRCESFRHRHQRAPLKKADIVGRLPDVDGVEGQHGDKMLSRRIIVLSFRLDGRFSQK
jgi:hypothetical protein